jgi:hypothetical protein
LYDACVFICAEEDFSRVGALVNITRQNSGTFTSNIYIVPDSWDDTQDWFFVGGTAGGRAGAVGYTAAEWMTGTAGSVDPANTTSGTISVSGEQVIRMPIAQIRALIGGGSNNPIYRR